MSDINKEIGARIASRLAQSGKSQADLAAYMNVTHSAVSSWVAGDKVPRMDKIDKICSFFNCNRSDLLIESAAPNVNARERLLLYYYSLLPVEDKEKVDDLIRSLLVAGFDENLKTKK